MSVATLKSMIVNIPNKILGVFGVSFVKTEDVEAATRIWISNMELKNQIDSLQALLSVKDRQHVLNFDVGDPSPKDQEARRAYIADASLSYTGLWEPKMKHLISVSHRLLENGNNSKDEDAVLKGAIFAFRELMRWGNMIVSEQRSNESERVSEPDNVKAFEK